nr:hypothetical protein [Tanacetum cinerariifolium]
GLDVTKDESTECESESWGNDDDDSNDEAGSERENDSEEHESDSEQDTDGNGSELDFKSDQQDDDDEAKDDDDEVKDDDDKSKGDENRGMDSDYVQDKKADKTEVHVTSSSRSSDLASKFLNFSNIPPTDAEIVSPLDVCVHHEVPRIYTSTLFTVPISVIPEASPVYTNIPQSSQTFTSPPIQSIPSPLPTTITTNILPLILDFASIFRFKDRVSDLEKDVAKLKNDPLHTQVSVFVDDHLDTRKGKTREKFMNFLLASLTNRITKQVRNQLPQILSKSSKGTNSQPKSSGKSVHAKKLEFEVGDTDTPQEPTDPDWNEDKTPQKGLTQNWLINVAASTSTGKSLKEFDELVSTQIDFSSYILNGLKIKNMTQEILLGPAFRLLKGTRSNYTELEYDFEECYKVLSEKLDWENPIGGDYPFDLSKPLPLITCGNRQSLPVEYFINNDLKYLQGGVLTMTYTMSNTKTKATQYDLPCIKDMRKTFYACARGIQSIRDVYFTKHILVVTHVSVIKKHGYGCLEEIMVRRADNKLYKFKEGDDVADFVIALRMFTRSLVIQKRVKDLQIRVESYQK